MGCGSSAAVSTTAQPQARPSSGTASTAGRADEKGKDRAEAATSNGPLSSSVFDHPFDASSSAGGGGGARGSGDGGDGTGNERPDAPTATAMLVGDAEARASKDGIRPGIRIERPVHTPERKTRRLGDSLPKAGASDAGSDAPPEQIRDYVVESALGSGKFSVVYRALAPSGEYVAIKRLSIYDIMDRRAREAYLNEVEVLTSLNHPHIISFHDAFIDHRQLFIVMELADIGDLRKLITKAKQKGQHIDEKTVWKLFYQIAAAIRQMHSQRIMHRDLKPANVFVSKNAVVKVGDVGLGRIFSSQTQAARSMCGTPYYMSPERIKGVDYDFKSDVWSMGCMLYEMAALQNPFYQPDVDIITLARLAEAGEYPDLPPAYSSDMADLIGHMLVVDAEARWDSSEVYSAAKAKVMSFVEASGSGT